MLGLFLPVYGNGDPYNLRINEVNVDSMVPFLEFKKNLPSGEYPTFDFLKGHGVLLADLRLGYVKTKDKANFLNVKAYIDLSDTKMLNGQEYGVIDMHEIVRRLRRYPNQLEVPNHNWKISGHAVELFKVKDDNMLAIFLTYSANKNLRQEDFFRGFHSSSRKEVIEYIKSNTIDSLIIKGEGQLNPIAYDLMKSELNVEAKEYLPGDHLSYQSLQKCKSLGEPHNLANFKFGSKSPGNFVYYIKIKIRITIILNLFKISMSFFSQILFF